MRSLNGEPEAGVRIQAVAAPAADGTAAQHGDEEATSGADGVYRVRGALLTVAPPYLLASPPLSPSCRPAFFFTANLCCTWARL